MKKYNVKVNGKPYEVEIELVDENSSASAENNHVEKPQVQSTASNTDDKINAPMSGTILAVNVEVGQNVNKGDAIFVLEAMKMENQISATKNGKITAIFVKKGDSVENGTPLCSIQ